LLQLKEDPTTKKTYIYLPPDFVAEIHRLVKEACSGDKVTEPMADNLADLLLNAIAPDLFHLQEMLDCKNSVSEEATEVEKIDKQVRKLLKSLKGARDNVFIKRKQRVELQLQLKGYIEELSASKEYIQEEKEISRLHKGHRWAREFFAQALAAACQKLSLPVAKSEYSFFAMILDACLSLVDSNGKHNIPALVMSITLPQKNNR